MHPWRWTTRAGVLLAISLATHGCASQIDSALALSPEPPLLGAPLERIGRPLTGNALLAPLAGGEVSNPRKEQYNRAAPADWPQFTADIERTLGLYDGFDHQCGNQWLAHSGGASSSRYHALATLLADDRLWIDRRSTVCNELFAVERAALGGPAAARDCGGRTPNLDAVDAYRSLLVLGRTTGVVDGVESDDRVHSTSDFPFLAPP